MEEVIKGVFITLAIIFDLAWIVTLGIIALAVFLWRLSDGS